LNGAGKTDQEKANPAQIYPQITQIFADWEEGE